MLEDLVVAHCGNLEVDLGDLLEPIGVGVTGAQPCGQGGDGPGGEDIGDHRMRGVEPLAYPRHESGREHRVAAEGEEVVCRTDGYSASPPSTVANRSANAVSRAPLGATNSVSSESDSSARRTATRSSLPFGVSGNSSSTTIRDGTM